MAESKTEEVTPLPPTDSQEGDCEDNEETDDDFHTSVNLEMETMNESSQRLNKISKALQDAKKQYVEFLQKSTVELQTLQKKNAKALHNSKPFYDVYKEARELTARSREAATRYERASQKHQAAKEIVGIAEAKLMEQAKGVGGVTSLDPAWQEALSDAVARVNATEVEKRESEEEHLRLTLTLKHVMERYRSTEIKLRKDIRKAHLFYERRSALAGDAKKLKEYIQTLEEDHTSCRTSYRKAMKNLEDLSNSIHRKRSSSTVNRNSFIEDVDTVELEAAVAGLHLGGEMRDSDEYIHYNPGEVDSLSASSLSQEGDFTVQSDSENLVEGLMPLVEEEDCKAHPLSKVHSDSMLVPRLDNEGQPIVRTDNRDSQVPGEDHQVVAKHKEDVQQLTEEDKLDQPKFVVSVNDQPVSAEDGDHPVSGDVRDNHPVSGEDQDVQPASEEDRDGQLVSGEDRDQPVSGEDGDQPVSGEDRDQTVSREDGDQPVSGEDRDQTVSGEDRDQTEFEEDRDNQPVSGEDRDQPVSGEDRDQTVSGEDRDQIVSGEDRDQTEFEEDRDQTEFKEDRDGQPVSGEDRDGQPVSGEDRDDQRVSGEASCDEPHSTTCEQQSRIMDSESTVGLNGNGSENGNNVDALQNGCHTNRSSRNDQEGLGCSPDVGENTNSEDTGEQDTSTLSPTTTDSFSNGLPLQPSPL